MDLNENIKIAFEVYWKNLPVTTELNTDSHSEAFIEGAKSQAAKNYWYNEFKRQKLQSDSGQDQRLHNQPMKQSECFHSKSTLEANYATVQKDGDRRVTIVIPDLTKLDGVPEEYQRAKQYQQYIDEHPDHPISFDNWKYMVEHYEKPELISKNDIDDVVSKRIGIIGHVDHGKTSTVGLGLHESQKGLIIINMDTPLTPEERFEVMKNLKPDLSAIKSIVPIADVIPEKIQLTSFYDKISVPKEWDTRKQKKASHKRKNKRK